MNDTNWGKILNAGFGILQGIIGGQKSGTLESAAPPPQSGTPSWLVPVAIGAALLLLLKKKLF